MAKTYGWEEKLKEGHQAEQHIEKFLKERGVEITHATKDEQRRGIDFRIKR